MLPPALAANLEPIPGLVHGFSRRLPPGQVESRDETRARLSRELADQGRLHLLRQVHGTAVLRAPWTGTPEADAATAWEPGVLVGIETADCLPVLVVDPVRRAVAAAHAGWRGTAAEIGVRAVEALVRSGSRPEDLRVALGPCIGACCYEVGDEVLAACGPRLRPAFSARPGGRHSLDLQRANTLQLLGAGIREETVARVAECTRCRPDLYHSYRREGRGAGRMINYLGFAA